MLSGCAVNVSSSHARYDDPKRLVKVIFLPGVYELKMTSEVCTTSHKY